MIAMKRNTRKKLLIIFNAVGLVCCLVTIILRAIVSLDKFWSNMIVFGLLFFGFLFLSTTVYLLSLIVDALIERNKLIAKSVDDKPTDDTQNG